MNTTETTTPRKRRARGTGWNTRSEKFGGFRPQHPDGTRKAESSHSGRKADAVALLNKQIGAKVHGMPVIANATELTFYDAAQQWLTAFASQKRNKSLAVVTRRVTKHLLPFFERMRLATITRDHVKAFVLHRRVQGIVNRRTGERISDVSPGEIDRELQCLQRIFTYAAEDGKIGHVPTIDKLHGERARTGFFEAPQLASVIKHLPPALQGPIQFAAITGWRVPSEVLTLTWSQIDFTTMEIRLDGWQTKSGHHRVFPITDDLKVLLAARQRARQQVQRQGHLVPWVFWRLVAKGRGGPKSPTPITTFAKAWQSACRAAGCPGRIPHDLRRTSIRAMVRRGIPRTDRDGSRRASDTRASSTVTTSPARPTFTRTPGTLIGESHTAADRRSWTSCGRR